MSPYTPVLRPVSRLAGLVIDLESGTALDTAELSYLADPSPELADRPDNLICAQALRGSALQVYVDADSGWPIGQEHFPVPDPTDPRDPIRLGSPAAAGGVVVDRQSATVVSAEVVFVEDDIDTGAMSDSEIIAEARRLGTPVFVRRMH